MYQFLETHPGSNYRQLWVKGRHIRAEVLYRHTIGPEPRTPEEIAADYDLPVDFVNEAVHYVTHESLLTSERDRSRSSRRSGEPVALMS